MIRVAGIPFTEEELERYYLLDDISVEVYKMGKDRGKDLEELRAEVLSFLECSTTDVKLVNGVARILGERR